MLPKCYCQLLKFDPKNLIQNICNSPDQRKVLLPLPYSASHFSIPLIPHTSYRSLERGSLRAEIVFLSYPMSFRLSYCAVILAVRWIHTRIDRIHTSLHNFRIRIKPVFSSRKIAPESRFHVAAVVQSCPILYSF